LSAQLLNASHRTGRPHLEEAAGTRVCRSRHRPGAVTSDPTAHHTSCAALRSSRRSVPRAADQIRTRDPELGKPRVGQIGDSKKAKLFRHRVVERCACRAGAFGGAICFGFWRKAESEGRRTSRPAKKLGEPSDSALACDRHSTPSRGVSSRTLENQSCFQRWTRSSTANAFGETAVGLPKVVPPPMAWTLTAA
jgi:hypothetical protein